MMYQNTQGLPYNTLVVLRLLDETVLPRMGNKKLGGSYTQYSFGRGDVTVRHDPVPRGVFVHVRGKPFNREAEAGLLERLRAEYLDVEPGLSTEDGRYYIISEGIRHKASNGT